MKFSTAAILVIFATTTPAASVHIGMLNRSVVPNSYIVVLKSNASMDDHIKGITRISARSPGSEFSIAHRHANLNSYSANATGASLNGILSSPEVLYVEADAVHSIDDVLHEVNERDETTRDVLVEPEGCASEEPCTNPILIFVLSGGMFPQHNCFGGRARWGPSYVGAPHEDKTGHGTAVAGIAIASECGGATCANAISVKIVSDDGIILSSNLVRALAYVYEQFRSGKRVIALTPLTVVWDQGVNEIFRRAVAGGLHVIAGAGDSSEDVKLFSPTAVEGVFTIGAIDDHNMFASFSNQGSLIKAFGLGVDVDTLGVGSPSAGARWSGTGMAAALAARVVARAIYLYGNGDLSNDEIYYLIARNGEKKVWGQPPGTTTLKVVDWMSPPPDIS
ncbi:peptidase S8/S53 domain-containing protein [Cantharellus anzutake]|uniref:peptidase S8/S53 domain-containing protein n=1 Tax=Cantharellus anzutake TaxID=1750568 RepID=UPI001905226D|nr:peptidase S8/S53 domain-containing protein [Cantharellus anzutake]KAF8324361.1 peptidase S8/S53 domain-containing protein [Cantharellus anzutake]